MELKGGINGVMLVFSKRLSAVSIQQICGDHNKDQNFWGAQAGLQVLARGSPIPTSPHQLQPSTEKWHGQALWNVYFPDFLAGRPLSLDDG